MSLPDSERFESCWISFGLPGVGETCATYDGFGGLQFPDWDTIPPNLDWLASSRPSPRDGGLAHNNHLTSKEEQRKRFNQLHESSPPQTPSDFLKFLGNENLQDKIPSCTACYVDYPTSWSASPFAKNDKILRFLNDQQCCYCWYLYLPQHGDPFVIASGGVYDEDSDYNETFLEDAELDGFPARRKLALESTFKVAPDFTTFIYRFWLENLIWYKLHNFELLTPEELRYVRWLDPDFVPPTTQDSKHSQDTDSSDQHIATTPLEKRRWWEFWK